MKVEGFGVGNRREKKSRYMEVVWNVWKRKKDTSWLHWMGRLGSTKKIVTRKYELKKLWKKLEWDFRSWETTFVFIALSNLGWKWPKKNPQYHILFKTTEVLPWVPLLILFPYVSKSDPLYASWHDKRHSSVLKICMEENICR